MTLNCRQGRGKGPKEEKRGRKGEEEKIKKARKMKQVRRMKEEKFWVDRGGANESGCSCSSKPAGSELC